MPRIEILTIGDELVEGRLVDSNAATLSERLADAGFPVRRHASVGDDPQDIAATLREAATRSDVVLISGGLGPTEDDLTARAAAEAFGLTLVRSPEALRHVERFFATRGRPMSPNNTKQADLPEGADVLPNPRGTAVGFRLRAGRCRLYFMPGVPHELEVIFCESVLPELRSTLGAEPARVAVLKVFGTGESDVARLLEGLGGRLPERIRLKVQYRATFPEIHVRLVLSGVDGGRAENLLESLAADARRRLASYVYASGGPELETTFAQRVVTDLRRAGMTVAFAEGCTGGLAGQLLGAADPEGEVFAGAVVTPTARAISSQLGVAGRTTEETGILAEETVQGMAEAVRGRFSSSLGVAAAGTSRAAAKHPAGTLRVAVADGARCSSRSFHFPLEADRFRLLAAYLALSLARRAVTGERKP